MMSQKDDDVLKEIGKFLLSEGISSYIMKGENASKLGFGNRYAVYKFIMKTRPYSFVKFEKLCDAGYHLWHMIKK